ncbi:MAG: L-threonylcarbamoyladenylate synthase [Archaeoglobaceae archaeon]|nr:L-threonylcarbamoyladenylate synthase [Archaeoglobaceae archaeon]MDW7989045.1 L-threonylcarbamoyladenylate synthase [Archaeoglobaceae archaeon]
MELLKPEEKGLKRAVEILEKGGLVAFPTETVYGLGCDAMNEKAVERLFEVKKRPKNKPLIVGVADLSQVYEIAEVNEIAEKLMRSFFPGPLTLIFKKKKIPDIVTGGSKKVAIRMPAHEIPLKLIRDLGKPVVVPSANISGRFTPTKFEHVIAELGDKIDAIVIGDCKIGLESTILDVTVFPPKILRHGAISVEEIKKFIEVHEEETREFEEKFTTSAEIYVFVGEEKEKMIRDFLSKREDAIVIARKDIYGKTIVVGEKVEDYAKNVFDALIKAEKMGAKVILVEGVEERGIGKAVMDRLYKSAKKVFHS